MPEPLPKTEMEPELRITPEDPSPRIHPQWTDGSRPHTERTGFPEIIVFIIGEIFIVGLIFPYLFYLGKCLLFLEACT